MHPGASHQVFLSTEDRKLLRTAKVRLRGGLLAVVCFGAVVFCWVLVPRSGGFGTHEQIGLPSCSFLVQTGYPCPSCGLTTSVVSMAHGRLWRAFEAHPFGVLLFAGIVFYGGVGVAELLTARSISPVLRPRWWWVLVALGAMLAGWGVKILAGLLSGTLPLR